MADGETPNPQANAKAGAYPMADRANLFGTLFVQFFDRESSEPARARAYEGLLAVSYPKARNHKEFKALYKEVSEDGKLNYDKMLRVVMMLCVVMDEIGTWDYNNPPNDSEELVLN